MPKMNQTDKQWEKALNALTNLTKDKPQKEKSKKSTSSRLVWFFSYNEEYGYWDLHPRQQRLSAKGTWSKGRPIALKHLYNRVATFSYLTDQDLRICSFLNERIEYYRRYPNYSYDFMPKVLTELVGHPLIFWEDSYSVRMEFIKEEPGLLIKKQKNGTYKVAFPYAIDPDDEVMLVKETPTRIKVIEINANVKRIAEILDDGIIVPKKAKNRLLEAVQNISSFITLQSDIGSDSGAIEAVTADSRPHFHLLPFGYGLKINIFTRPFIDAGPYLRPGRGSKTLITEIDGKRCQTKRNLKREKELSLKAIEACPSLNGFENSEGEWTFDDPEDCLEAILELKALGEDSTIEWPEGEGFSLRQTADISMFHISIKKQKSWFAVQGNLKLDDGLVLSMQQLMKMIEDKPGRFLKLDDGKFIALTKSFRKRLEEFKTYSNKSGKDLQFHPLAALTLEDLSEQLGGFSRDKHFKTLLKRAEDIKDLKPTPPSTFQAELRDYQVEGFNWLARLAHWGVGACLADDMGLGKTIQALAIILQKAPKGPSLVVAPTSVCMNWEMEAERFAPTMKVVFLGSGKRKKILEQLKPFDMLVVSYGLLQQKKTSEMLSAVPFQTIVLDEAQAIKNFFTKRSQAAMNLQGEFKLITTGTPIENHLSELWNLFRFINPGLLGSLEHFKNNFQVPIEINQEKQARLRLKKLIRPFILRRKKSQVLEELPPRTEITLQVELSNKEMAFYEALRLKAVEDLSKDDCEPGKKHLLILAQIMKLRRTCCNTKLVMPDSPLQSAKLSVFGEILDELIKNKHKALVFSQFVDHLKIIREYVEKQNISYQYLDGSTPAKARKKRVEAFQSGEGELFLISLKAGGLGLNLTAADYVIHMDPWWNPAVEDQATDRVHRIGQTRPVTIYRLVTSHTIEEKIVALHQQKRDLADSLLDGTDMSGRISADELLRMIREQ